MNFFFDVSKNFNKNYCHLKNLEVDHKNSMNFQKLINQIVEFIKIYLKICNKILVFKCLKLYKLFNLVITAFVTCVIIIICNKFILNKSVFACLNG